MAGRLLSIGAVAVDYRRPNLKFTSAPTNKGARTCTLSGLAPLAAVLELSEMFAAPASHRTIAGFEGVLAWCVFDGDVLLDKTGYYLVSNFDNDIERELMVTTFTAFSMTAVYFGDLVS